MMDKKKGGGVYRTEFTIIPTKFTYKITIPRWDEKVASSWVYSVVQLLIMFHIEAVSGMTL